MATEELNCFMHGGAVKRMRNHIRRAACLTLMAAMLSGLPACSTVSFSIRKNAETKDSLRAAKVLREVVTLPFTAIEAFAKSATTLLEHARSFEVAGRKSEAAACYLKAAIDARELLIDGTGTSDQKAQASLLELHNSSLARFAELVGGEDLEIQQDGSARMVCDSEVYLVKMDPASDFAIDYFDRVVSADSVKGRGVVEKTRAGYGAALVGVRDKLPGREREMRFFLNRGMHVPAALTVEEVNRDPTGATRVGIALRNPIVHTHVSDHGRRFPLTANFTAPFEMLLSGKNELLWGLGGFFNARDRIKSSGIFLLEPYDPERIPVILTHGLASVPIIWRDLLPEFMSEPDISRRYQFFVFTYPSAFSIAQSARLFREQLAALRAQYDPRGKDPLSTNMVAVGHSMGGVLTHLLAADIGDHFWDEISDVPLEELELNAEQEKIARDLAYFDPDPALRRAVFISTPHGGARLATASFAGFLSSLVKLPVNVVTMSLDQLIPGQEDQLKINYGKRMTSVQSLAPDSPIVEALADSPYKQGVIYHSIIGDRGRGDTPDSSDGFVEYWSSHQEGAASELIVPTGHSAYRDPGAIAELKRILREHIGLK